MLVSELEGALLDYWVARAEGIKEADIIDHMPIMDEAPPSWCCLPNGRAYSPSTTWSIAGEIIERERIGIMPRNGEWAAWASGDMDPSGAGESALVAGMRAFVSSRFGKEVPDQ